MSTITETNCCERCQAELPQEAVFCPMCGTRRREPPEASATLIGGRYDAPHLQPDTEVGTVLEARALPAGGAVTVRVLPIENRDGGVAARDITRRLQQVLDLLGAEPHPSVGIALDVVEESGRVFIIEEPTEQPTLLDWLATHGPLQWRDLSGWATQALDTLSHAHARGVFHGGPRPEHLVVGEQGVLRLCGFGEAPVELAAKLDRAERFAPLELLGGRLPDAAADIYSFAVTLYELLVGSPPGHNHTGVIRVGDARPDLPSWVCEAVERALASDSRRRFGTAASFKAALERPAPVAEPPAEDADADWPPEDVDASPQPKLLTPSRPAPPFEPDTPLYGTEPPPPGAPPVTQGARPGSATRNRSLPPPQAVAEPVMSATELPEWSPDRLTAESRTQYAEKPMHSWTTARPTADAAALLASFTMIPIACLLISWLLPWWVGTSFVGLLVVVWRAFGDVFADNLRRRRTRLEASAVVGSRIRIHGWEAVPQPPPYNGAYEFELEAARQPNWWIDLTISPPPGAGAPFPFRGLRRWAPRGLFLVAPRGEPGVAVRRVAVHDGRGFLLDDIGLKKLGPVRLRLLVAIPSGIDPPTLHYLDVPLADLRPPVGVALEYLSAA